jgi:hypothetical protein
MIPNISPVLFTWFGNNAPSPKKTKQTHNTTQHNKHNTTQNKTKKTKIKNENKKNQYKTDRILP